MNFPRLILLLVLGAALGGCGDRAEPPPTPSIPRMPAPHFELTDLEGNKISSDSFFGKIVILNFWASWSPGCVREIPEWVKLQAEYEAKGVVFVGINVDAEGVSIAKPYAEKRKINYPILMGSMDLGSEFGGLDGIPSTFIIDREWNLINRYTGLTAPEAIRSEIQALLRQDRVKSMGGSNPTQTSPAKTAGEEGPSPYAPKQEEEKKAEPAAETIAPSAPLETTPNSEPVKASDPVPAQ